MSSFQQLRHARPATIVGTFVFAGLGLTVYTRLMMSTAHADSRAPRKIFPGGFANVTLQLESSEQVNHNTKRLKFQLPKSDDITGLPLTSALLTLTWPQGKWYPVPRPYTPISSSDEPGYFELLVKRYPGGKGSGYLHSLKPGDSLRFLASLRGFAWTPNKYEHITLIAGGAGITPVFQLIQGILLNPDDRTRITLVFGVNGDQDLLLKDQFDDFTRRYPGRFRATYAVSNPGPESIGLRGYVTKELLQEVVPRNGKDTKVMVCGPPAMEESLLGKKKGPGVLEQMGYKKDQIFKF